MKNKKKYLNFGLSLLLSAVSGLLMLFSFPAYDYYLLAFVALVPLLIVINTQGAFQSFLGVIIFVLVFYYNFLNWIEVFHPLALPGVILYLCLIYPIPFFMFRWMRRKKEGIYNVFLFAVIFVLFEYLREQGFSKFPYGIISYSQYRFLPFIQIADIVGHLGISFFIYYVNIAIADYFVSHIWGDRRFKQTTFLGSFQKVVFNRFGFIIIIFILIVGYGNYRLQESSLDLTKQLDEKISDYIFDGNSTNRLNQRQILVDKGQKNSSIRVSIIQPWFVYNLRWTEQNKDILFDKLTRLTLEAAEENPDLIFWPETAINDYYEFRLNLQNRNQNSFAKRFYQFFQSFGKRYPNIQILTGSLSLGEINKTTVIEEGTDVRSAKDSKTGALRGDVKKYNSALLINNQGEVLQRSAKKYLVPIAEYFPYKAILKQIPWFATLLRQAHASNFTPFEKYEIFNHIKGNFAVLVCYEDTFFDLSRDYILKGAEYLVVITNDAWSYTKESQLIHYAFAFFRAIENHRYVVRVGNAGVSGLIDPQGREIGVIPQFEEGYTTVEFSINKKKNLSFFTKYGGNLFILLVLIIFIFFNFIFIVSKIILFFVSIANLFRWIIRLLYTPNEDVLKRKKIKNKIRKS